tara:strand:+ start:903 stop:1799 length:897 start_codon:yes stop_codon:yes gene_type:complete
MNIIEYNDIDNKGLDQSIIDKLVSKREKLIVDEKKFYFSLSLPLIDYNNDKNIKGKNTQYETELDYSSLLTEKISGLYIYKLVFYLEKDKYIITDDIDKLNFIDKNAKILKLFINIIDKCERDYRRLNEILYVIKRHVTWLDFFNSYKMIEYLDKLLYYILSYNNVVNDMIMIVSRIIIIIEYDKDKKDNNDYELFKNRIKVFQKNVINLKDSLEQTRHGTMQRIAYLDSGTSRILTIVAAIFLPTSFIISLLSMPFEGVPFKGRKNGYLIVLSIITAIFLTLLYLFMEDFKNLFRKQ